MRKPSPISISSPRETTTSRPSASAASASSTARRVVVDDERGLGAGQPPQERREVILPRAARAALEVVLEVRVAAAHLDDPRRAPPRRAARGRGSCARARRSRSARGAATGRRARASSVEHGLDESAGSRPARISSRARSSTRARRRDRELVRLAGEPLVGEQAVDRRQVAQRRRRHEPVWPRRRYAASAGRSSRRSAVSRGPRLGADREHVLVLELPRPRARRPCS